MTTLAQGQKDNKPAVLAGFILLLSILAIFILTTFWDTLSSTVAAIKTIPEIKYQPHAVEKHGSDALVAEVKAALRACARFAHRTVRDLLSKSCRVANRGTRHRRSSSVTRPNPALPNGFRTNCGSDMAAVFY